jgi:hypothetical protein
MIGAWSKSQSEGDPGDAISTDQRRRIPHCLTSGRTLSRSAGTSERAIGPLTIRRYLDEVAMFDAFLAARGMPYRDGLTAAGARRGSRRSGGAFDRCDGPRQYAARYRKTTVNGRGKTTPWLATAAAGDVDQYGQHACARLGRIPTNPSFANNEPGFDDALTFNIDGSAPLDIEPLAQARSGLRGDVEATGNAG